jgi:hypothetical protein
MSDTRKNTVRIEGPNGHASVVRFFDIYGGTVKYVLNVLWGNVTKRTIVEDTHGLPFAMLHMAVNLAHLDVQAHPELAMQDVLHAAEVLS